MHSRRERDRQANFSFEELKCEGFYFYFKCRAESMFILETNILLWFFFFFFCCFFFFFFCFFFLLFFFFFFFFFFFNVVLVCTNNIFHAHPWSRLMIVWHGCRQESIIHGTCRRFCSSADISQSSDDYIQNSLKEV